MWPARVPEHAYMYVPGVDDATEVPESLSRKLLGLAGNVQLLYVRYHESPPVEVPPGRREEGWGPHAKN